ncbi:sulfurtransferase [Altericroceibacterium endophyticum]|uniref:Sulfurtransferase n=1 Tax=Altericroceibacterium endophyticum TaxID=1808508 RepID=A0A6I4T577_9SPHN|nr:sulfurtransferase [Altericroceibacterium endophyticum]MXO66384.1 sulfurtransferase [Altericroceibacterium endophyticum]
MDSLVSTQWLAATHPAPDLCVLDASSHLPMAGRDAGAEFADAHIPGARFLDLTTLIDTDSTVPAALPTAEQFARRLQDLGIDPEMRIVFYDDSEVKTSARAWFIFRLYGLKNLAILDGGLAKWRAEGQPLESGAHQAQAPATEPEQRAFAAQTGQLRDKADMLANCSSAREQVLDARDAGRFAGEIPDFRPNVPSGHIPGSRNLPFTALFHTDGTFKSPGAMRAEFVAAGIDPDAPLITTCGGGVTAAVLLFAAQLFGKQDVALYDGSWSEWAVDPATPKATGAAS